ncbi:unnamed protein product [Arctia plantaginis]|uniref:Uncharacterized protein n=1 Tax=Arctia plantaginis TaxID=874455 RepID=A0A8S1BCI8_ARCPL|nr:unnamed protein product [Arctia plantaginis]
MRRYPKPVDTEPLRRKYSEDYPSPQKGVDPVCDPPEDQPRSVGSWRPIFVTHRQTIRVKFISTQRQFIDISNKISNQAYENNYREIYYPVPFSLGEAIINKTIKKSSAGFGESLRSKKYERGPWNPAELAEGHGILTPSHLPTIKITWTNPPANTVSDPKDGDVRRKRFLNTLENNKFRPYNEI